MGIRGIKDCAPWINRMLLFQINLQKKMRVTGVITQGAKRIGSPEYVKSYKIAYSNDGKSWTMYKVKGTKEDMVRLSHLYLNASHGLAAFRSMICLWYLSLIAWQYDIGSTVIIFLWGKKKKKINKFAFCLC